MAIVTFIIYSLRKYMTHYDTFRYAVKFRWRTRGAQLQVSPPMIVE